MLTPKQEAFVKGIMEGKTQAEAYRSAYSCNNMSDNSIYREASLLMDSPKIAQRLKELRDQMIKPTIMSAQERLEYLTRVVKGEEVEEVFSWEDGERVTASQPASIKTRLQAIDLMNKMQGEYVQKVVADVDTSYTINIELSDD